MEKANFDLNEFIQIHKTSAIKTFRDKLDKNRNVVGTDYYFDEFWRFRKRN